MRYVIIRDDDTNALTPVECLERLYRPFLNHGLPVNLAVIPAVTTDATKADGAREGFLPQARNAKSGIIPISDNPELVRYILENPGYEVVQHGCHHDYLEFERTDPHQITLRLDQGTALLREAGFPRPLTFVAPYDKLSRPSLRQVSSRFRVLSTGWFELKRLPCTWWPLYVLKKMRRAPHWRVGRTLLLSHPGCILSCERTYTTMLAGILHHVNTHKLTVLVTHWWEYFRNGHQDNAFVEFLHETAHYLATHPELKVITFSELVNRDIALN